MRHATLPADAGIGSNDVDALARAHRADENVQTTKPAPVGSPVKNSASGKSSGQKQVKGGFIDKFKGM